MFGHVNSGPLQIEFHRTAQAVIWAKAVEGYAEVGVKVRTRDESINVGTLPFRPLYEDVHVTKNDRCKFGAAKSLRRSFLTSSW